MLHIPDVDIYATEKLLHIYALQYLHECLKLHVWNMNKTGKCPNSPRGTVYIVTKSNTVCMHIYVNENEETTVIHQNDRITQIY